MQPPLSLIIEAIIFVSDQPVKIAFLQDVLQPETTAEQAEGEDQALPGPSEEEIRKALQALEAKYQDARYPFEIRPVAGGYQFYTKRDLYPYVKKAVVNKNQKRLSRSALETVSIIAYRQPITKAEVEFIRGVNCDYAIQKLLEKKLISIVGRADAPGRPLLYATSPFFMEYFGMSDLSDLPKLKEFADMEEDHLDKFRQQQEEAHETESGEEEAVLAGDEGAGQAEAESPAEEGVAEADASSESQE